MPTYQFNQHRHVKIWLSKDRDSFLNLENRVRLAKMRKINPDDEINFVYDSQLLSPQALEELSSFCIRYRITPKDVRTDVFPHCQTAEETQLISIYNDEISHLQEGGNVAVGSDILRWLCPVYTLGTYTDFDVHVDTHNLPLTMDVEKPLLMNLGSTASVAGTETVYMNNDTISVVDSQAALEDIKKIQTTIISSCTKQAQQGQNFFASYESQFQNELGRVLSPEIATHIQYPDKQALDKLSMLSKGKTAREIRRMILAATTADFAQITLAKMHKYIKFLGSPEVINASYIGLAATETRKIIKQALSSKTLSPEQRKEMRALDLIKNDNALLVRMHKSERMMALKNSVVYTTGPSALMRALYNQLFFSEYEVNEIIPSSFSRYGLDKAFVSANSMPFHTSEKDARAKLQAGEMGISNDLSWLLEGQEATVQREQKIRDMQSYMPQHFNELRGKIEDHIEKIQADLKGCLGFYRHKARGAKIEALQAILQHFDERTFNVTAFKAAIASYRTTDVSASIGKSKTKKLIDELERFAQQAEDYLVTDAEGRVTLPPTPPAIELDSVDAKLLK